jgi:hypothetical protein
MLKKHYTLFRRYTDFGVYFYLRFMVIATILASCILAGLLSYWAFDSTVPIETYPKPYKVVYPEDKIVRQGEFITYEFSYNKTSDLVPKIQRQFVDGLIFNVAGEQTPTVANKGRGVARAQLHIPETLPPGKYYVRITATYDINPIKDYVNVSKTETFEVVSGSDSSEQQDALDINDANRRDR